MRGAAEWSIVEKNGNFQIVPYRKNPKGDESWVEDRDHKIELLSGSTADDVIDRMVAILQDAARKQ